MEVETKVSKNAAGEDVEALIKSNNDGKRYWCKLCKIVSMKAKVTIIQRMCTAVFRVLGVLHSCIGL